MDTKLFERAIEEQILYNTLRIEAVLKSGESAMGSAFFFQLTLDDGQQVALVATNKHVLEDAETIKFNLSSMVEGVPQDSKIFSTSWPCNRTNPNGPLYWLDHPDDEVDLAVAFTGVLHHAEKEFDTTFAIIYAQEDLIADQTYLEGVSVISDIIMVGYPDGLFDSVNNKPIVRKGITSTHPKHFFEGRKEFLIDVRSIHGSSGSPIYLHKRTLRLDGASLSMPLNLKLVGLLYGGFDTETGVITIEKLNKMHSHVNVDTGIGAVVSSVRLLEMKAHVSKLLGGLRRTNTSTAPEE